MSNSIDDSEQSKQMQQLLDDVCRHPPDCVMRQEGLTKLIRMITPKLMHYSDEHYPDALQLTWMSFCRNLCKLETGRTYNPRNEKTSLIAWVNRTLHFRLMDLRRKENRNSIGKISSDTYVVDLFDRLPARPEVPSWIESIRNWADTEPELLETHVNNHPEITARTLILRRLPPETSWTALSREYGVSASTLSRFYENQCMPRLRTFGHSQGYL